ncbi:protein stoned-A [Ceratitis capitata]|uniref:protein stoned-A n=1 Tax=Ceratitis capitata TaxID=7213 RepID=UPI0006188E8B|nr:protein stoned-A [Ceratitis capitata]XP_012157477.1 protein stoned-A [Ceratitis capitata]
MLKLPKGLKKKKKKSKKDQELFTEEELEQYKRDLRAKQEAAAAKSDAGESDAASDVEGLAPTAASTSNAAPAQTETTAGTTNTDTSANGAAAPTAAAKSAGEDEEWAKFKALTSGVDTILHKTQDELDRIKKESFYQRLPSAAEKKRLEEEEAARREAERLEEERRKAAELEAQRDKLAEAVVELSESDGEQDEEIDDIFATDYIEAITSGEVQLAVVPESPVLDLDDGPDPFDTAYAEKVIVGADKAKGNKKLVSLGAAVEVLSGRVDREHALALAKPKRKLRKGIQNLLLSESIDLADQEVEIVAAEPQKNLLDELVDDVPEPDAPIDLSVSLHLHLIQHKKQEEDEEEEEENGAGLPDLSEFDTLKDDDDDEFAELAAESLTKKEEVKVITQIPIPQPEALSEVVDADWAEFEQTVEEESQAAVGPDGKAKPARPPPPARPTSGPHLIPGAIYVSDDEEDFAADDPFNTAYAEQVIKKTTVLEEDDDFDPRAEEKSAPPVKPPPPAASLLSQPTRDLLGGSATDLSKVGPAPIAPTQETEEEPADFDPFDTSAVSAIVQPKATELKFLERELLPESNLKHSLSDPDFDPRADEPTVTAAATSTAKPPARPAAPIVQTQYTTPTVDFDTARRKSSLSLNIQSKSVGFLVPTQDLLGASNDGHGNKKPLTPYYAPSGAPEKICEKDSEDPFDTSYVPEAKPSEVELKHLEQDLLTKNTLKHSISDPDFDPRAPPTPVPAEELLAVKEDIKAKVLTPSQESKDIPDDTAEYIDPFDTSIASNLQPGKAELKLLESELLPPTVPEITTGVLDTQTDAQELGLGDKVLTPSVPVKQITLPEEVDPFDTSIAENLAPGATEIKLLESELIER